MIDKELKNAIHHLENAKICISDKMFDLAVVSAYTSMFHCARSLLFGSGYKERSHVCLISFLKEKYPELNELTNSMDTFRGARHTMLYGIDPMVLKEDAIAGIERSADFIDRVRSMIKRQEHME